MKINSIRRDRLTQVFKMGFGDRFGESFSRPVKVLSAQWQDLSMRIIAGLRAEEIVELSLRFQGGVGLIKIKPLPEDRSLVRVETSLKAWFLN